MDLISGYPFNLIRDGLVQIYPSIDRNIKTDVVIIGAGISGALIGYHLVQQGFQITFVDKRHAASGSTAASTSLLQYEPDATLTELSKRLGKQNAFSIYHECRDAVIYLGELMKPFNQTELYERKTSYYFVSKKKDAIPTLDEFKLRREAGLDVSYFSRKDVEQLFGIKTYGAIRTGTAAQSNAFRMTHVLLDACLKKGANVFSKTSVDSINSNSKTATLKTESGHVIKARYVVFANGYEALETLGSSIAQLKVTYAAISEQIDTSPMWHEEALLWESSRPYKYLRTFDKRIIIGGRDESYSVKAMSQKSLQKKTEELQRDFIKWFPNINFKTDFSWSGAFAETNDSLPYIGSVKQFPSCYFALGYGGNGILFSIIAAQMITSFIQNKSYPHQSLFGFDR